LQKRAALGFAADIVGGWIIKKEGNSLLLYSEMIFIYFIFNEFIVLAATMLDPAAIDPGLIFSFFGP